MNKNIKGLEELDCHELIHIEGGSEFTESLVYGVGLTIGATASMLRVTAQSYVYVLSWLS